MGTVFLEVYFQKVNYYFRGQNDDIADILIVNGILVEFVKSDIDTFHYFTKNICANSGKSMSLILRNH